MSVLRQHLHLTHTKQRREGGVNREYYPRGFSAKAPMTFSNYMHETKIRSSIPTLFYTQLSSTNLTSVKVVDGVVVLVKDTEAGRLVVVLVRVPEDVHLVEGLAGNGAPESLGVLDGSDLFDGQ